MIYALPDLSLTAFWKSPSSELLVTVDLSCHNLSGILDSHQHTQGDAGGANAVMASLGREKGSKDQGRRVPRAGGFPGPSGRAMCTVQGRGGSAVLSTSSG